MHVWMGNLCLFLAGRRAGGFPTRGQFDRSLPAARGEAGVAEKSVSPGNTARIRLHGRRAADPLRRAVCMDSKRSVAANARERLRSTLAEDFGDCFLCERIS